jgi:hypothetical protein
VLLETLERLRLVEFCFGQTVDDFNVPSGVLLVAFAFLEGDDP